MASGFFSSLWGALPEEDGDGAVGVGEAGAEEAQHMGRDRHGQLAAKEQPLQHLVNGGTGTECG